MALVEGQDPGCLTSTSALRRSRFPIYYFPLTGVRHNTSAAFVSEVFTDQEQGMDRIPMTREGYDKKKAELDRLQNVVMIEITKRVATAREMGDLSENAEYHAAREDQGMLQARINMLRDELGRAMIVDP